MPGTSIYYYGACATVLFVGLLVDIGLHVSHAPTFTAIAKKDPAFAAAIMGLHIALNYMMYIHLYREQ